MLNILTVLLAAAFMGTATLHARTCLQEIAGPPEGYEHNRFGVQPSDQVREFSAYLVSFDGADDDDGDGTGDARRIPEWVAYEMRASGHRESGDRPGRWCHDRELEGAGSPRATVRTPTVAPFGRDVPTGSSEGIWPCDITPHAYPTKPHGILTRL